MNILLIAGAALALALVGHGIWVVLYAGSTQDAVLARLKEYATRSEK